MKTCEETRRTETATASACHAVLKEHIANPWRWPRESDVVGSLVNKIHDLLADEMYAKPCVSRTVLEGSRIPRVRTEVRIKGESWKIDVCLQTQGTNNVFFGRGGPRDVLLTVSPSQIEEIVEVKLNPGLLYTGWIDDLIKLHNIRGKICEDKQHKLKSLHALFIDTSLPLCSLCKSAERKSGPSKAKGVPLWPLEVVGESEPIYFEYPRPDQTWQITLRNRTEPESKSGPHIYLWVIGSKPGATPTHEPACWKVEIAKKTDAKRP